MRMLKKQQVITLSPGYDTCFQLLLQHEAVAVSYTPKAANPQLAITHLQL